MASCARRSLAAATSFMALVIFCVDLTDAIRVRTAFSDGMERLWCSLQSGRELLGELGQHGTHLGGEDVEGLAIGALAA